MEAPKCSQCGERHYGMCPDKDPFKKAKARPDSMVHKEQAVSTEPVTSLLSPEGDSITQEFALEIEKNGPKDTDTPPSVTREINRGPLTDCNVPTTRAKTWSREEGLRPLTPSSLPTIEEAKARLKVLDKERSLIKARLRRYNQRERMRKRRKKAKK